MKFHCNSPTKPKKDFEGRRYVETEIQSWQIGSALSLSHAMDFWEHWPKRLLFPDGCARCPGCRKCLVSATTFAQRIVLRLTLLWLKACSRFCPRIVGAARGVYLPLGRRLVLAGLQALSILPVSLATTGPVFGRVTFDWLHEAWNKCGWLSEDLGLWMLGEMRTVHEAALHMIQVKDASLPAQAAMPSLVDGSDFLSAAATHITVNKPAESAAAVDGVDGSTGWPKISTLS